MPPRREFGRGRGRGGGRHSEYQQQGDPTRGPAPYQPRPQAGQHQIQQPTRAGQPTQYPRQPQQLATQAGQYQPQRPALNEQSGGSSQPTAQQPRVEASSEQAGSTVTTLAGRVEALHVAQPARPSVPQSSKALRPVAKPGVGTFGKPVVLRVNHFKLGLNLKSVFHYDVSVKPEISSKSLKRQLEQQLVVQYRGTELGNRLPVYDGMSNLFTAGKLPFDRKEFEVAHPDDPKRHYKITIKFAAELDSTQLDRFLQARQPELPHEFLQALDVALREWPTSLFVPIGRSFFHQQFGSQPLDGGLEACKGFFQSLRPTMQGLVLNIDMSATAFYEPIGVIDFLRKSIGIDPIRGLRDAEKVKTKKLLFRLMVEVTHRDSPRRYRVAGLSAGPIKNLKFPLDDGTEMKVVDYFRQAYNYQIKFQELPCLELQGKKVSYLPMEVCRIRPGQKFRSKLAERQTTSILRFACQSPADRANALGGVLQRVHGPQGNEFAKEFGIRVDLNMSTVSGRILPPPKLRYLNSQVIQPRKGEWNMLDSKFFQPASVDCWAVVNFSNARENEVHGFAQGLIRRCSEIGMQLQQPAAVNRGRIEDFPVVIRNVIQRAGAALKLIVCIMDGRHPLYNELKRVCETEIGVVTQCCLRKNISGDYKKLSQYLANLAMKINVKAGGKNVVLFDELPRLLPRIFNTPTIIFGADVSHPAVGDLNSPSLAAVVASVDWPSATSYLARVRGQGHRVERLEALAEMTRELLIEFYRRTNTKPLRIVFFRDGVSEGQFQDVLDHEVTAIYTACARLEQNYYPKLTFVVVQKRHHTRFFPTDNNVERNNVLPGTVVDTVITHPSQFDFYLCSHKGLQGTSRPTHYHVLYDSNEFTADELQRLVNNLCYTYARCTKAVSIVPPAYYAHLVAYRARLYLEGTGSDHGSDAGNPTAPVLRELRPVCSNVQSIMFYC